MVGLWYRLLPDRAPPVRASSRSRARAVKAWRSGFPFANAPFNRSEKKRDFEGFVVFIWAASAGVGARTDGLVA